MPGVDEEYYRQLLKPLVEGRRVVVTGSVMAGAVQVVTDLQAAGAEAVFVLAEARGTGEVPEGVSWFDLEISAGSTMGSLRAGLAALGSLPPAAEAALDQFDPDKKALVVGSMFHELPEVAGRRSLSFRPPEWIAYEDKVIIEGCWDRWGVERAPSRVVPAELDALRHAAAAVDQGAGTMWVADAREGWHGGAEFSRWVRSEADGAEAAEFLSRHCDSARVMAFLEGIPCSIHGIVFDDHVIAVRPLEMVVLRAESSAELVYAGVASYWDPPTTDREHMRDIARRVGASLRSEVGYRGGFTIDGVMTAEGFRPTELNARPGAGLSVMARALPDLPLSLLLPAISGGHALDYRPRRLEELLVERADANRAGGTWRAMHEPVLATPITPLWHHGDGWHDADSNAGDEHPAHASFMAGPSPTGGFVRLILDHTVWPTGPSVAPAAAEFWSWYAGRTGSTEPPLSPAKSTRT